MGVPARPALPLPLLRKGQEKAAARVRSRWEAREAGKRTGSGFRATRAARPAPSYFLRDRARADAPRGKQPPASQAPGLALTSGTRRPPLTPVALNRDCYSSAARTRAVPATAGAGRLTWGRCAAATAPAATTGAAPPNTQGQGRTQVSRFVPKAGAEASQAAQLPSRELQARPTAEAKAHQPALRVLEPRRESLEIPPSPGAPFVVLLLSPALLLPPGSLLCLQPRNPRCRGSRASVRCPPRGSPWEPAGGRPGGYHIQTFPHLGLSFPSSPKRGHNPPEAQKSTQRGFILLPKVLLHGGGAEVTTQDADGAGQGPEVRGRPRKGRFSCVGRLRLHEEQPPPPIVWVVPQSSGQGCASLSPSRRDR